MKKYLLTVLFFISFFSYSQNNKESKINIGSISGNVLDSKTKQSLPYSTIICKNSLNEIVGGSITNKKGNFKINNLPLDSLTISFQFIGYKTVIKKINLSKNKANIKFNTVFLIEDNTLLDEVIVDSQTSTLTQKTDRKVFNIGKDLIVSGNNMLELLENIPSIQVNFQTGSLSLRGNENARVLVDGKPSNLSTNLLLKQIPSSSVKSIEIITNPSAKYSPEGMSGIINIILKKNTTIGFNGSFSLGAEHSINTRPTGSFDFNYRVGKINFYGNYGFDSGKYQTFSFFERLDKDLKQDIDFLDNSISNYGKIGFDYYINKKNTLSFYTNLSFTKTDFFVDTETVLNRNLVFDSENISSFDTQNEIYNFDYKLDFAKKGEYLEFEINYSKSKNPQEDIIFEKLNPLDKIYNYKNSILNNKSLLLINLDYSKPINNGTLEIGLESRTKNSFNKINTDQQVKTGGNPSTQPKGNSELIYDRDIFSAYISVSKEFNKVSLQTGLRAEKFSLDGFFFNTQQINLEPVKDNIFSLYPSAYITYSQSKKNQFQFGFSRRVDRPSIDQVTPIQEWTSPLSISIGNRNLNPQFTNSFELNYTKKFKLGYFSVGTFYRKTKDIIGRVFNVDTFNVDSQIISYTNYDSSKSYGFEFSSRFKLFKWWTFRPSTNIYIQDNQGFIDNNLKVTNNTLFTARISNSFKASQKLRFNLSANYKGNNENVLTKINDYFLVSASARLSVLKRKGTITLRARDIFDGYKLDFSSNNPFPQIGQFTLEYSSIYLGFNYNFGGGKNRERDRKYREENETQAGGIVE